MPTTPTNTAIADRPIEAELPEHVEIAIVGSGFSGLAMAVQLIRAGLRDFVVLERAHDVGGTWRENTYPGLACDVPSHLYSLSFAPNPDWTHTFSGGAEIQRYLQRVARDFGVLPHVRFGAEVQGAEWDDDRQVWRIETARGDLTARALVAAPGALHEPSIPEIPGLDRFQGAKFHSARWDHEHDLTGKRVAVVGTGASAIQFVPQIQPKVAELHLFQRTPPWVLPRRSRPLTRLEHALYRRVPAAQRAMRAAIFWGRELYALPMLHRSLSAAVRRVGLKHLEKTVPDPELRAKLTPDYAPGCKRILISNDYLPSLTRPNVSVETGGIAEVRERSVVTRDGREIEVDTIIFGTGFHVLDMPIGSIVRGRDGRTLHDVWGGSPQAHKGTTIAGFPNLFMLLGPNTGLGHNSVVFMAEAQVGYALEALRRLHRGAGTIEPRAEAQAAWNRAVQERMKGTVWTEGGCASWYLDANGLNTSLWPDFSFRFARELARFDAESYAVEPRRAPAREPALA